MFFHRLSDKPLLRGSDWINVLFRNPYAFFCRMSQVMPGGFGVL
jgi:hypothetical protein